MSLEFKFNIEELPDAKSFIFTDLTSNWETPNIEKTDVDSFKITFTKLIDATPSSEDIVIEPSIVDFPVADWVNGVLIPFDPILPDGSYEVKVELFDSSAVSIAETTEDYCFFAVIKDATMKQLLGYNQFLPKRSKELYWEKGRILDNLYYAAQTTQVLYFDENLAQLVKLG